MNELNFEIGGKTRGFKMGLGFLGDIISHYNTDIVGLGHIMVKNPFSATPAIVYYAHLHDCKRRGIPVDFTIFDAQDWVDSLKDPMNDPNLESLLTIMLDSIKKYLPKTIEDVVEGEKKS